MIALSLRFPAGRYHATPWGRHVNEAAIAWPPEPLRILRALIAVHRRKADEAVFNAAALASLIDALASRLPIYRLPTAVHAHTRHYMPAPVKTTLVFDAFARVDPDEPLIVGWPDLALDPQRRGLLDHLAERLGYLGRAESWVEATVREWDGEDANALPMNGRSEGSGSDPANGADHRLIHVYAPLAPDDYRDRRERLIREERERRRVTWKKSSKPTDAALEKDMKAYLTALPESLSEALAVDTPVLQAVGWSDPPATMRALYSAPEPATRWHGRRRRQTGPRRSDPTVARYVLAGRPRPRIEDSVRIGELMRLAALSRFGWTPDPDSGRARPNAPAAISGRDWENHHLRDPQHAHAFWLPEDADGDGEIDHVVVYAKAGFTSEVRAKLDRIVRLWVSPQRGDGKQGEDRGDEESGRQEWRLALEGFGNPADFRGASALLETGRHWISTTPFLAAGHLKSGGYGAEFRRLIERREVLGAGEAAQVEVEVLDCIETRGRPRRPIHFHRFRSRGREKQPDTLGTFLRVEFPSPISGPLALGYGCHFGLGLFRCIDGEPPPA